MFPAGSSSLLGRSVVATAVLATLLASGVWPSSARARGLFRRCCRQRGCCHQTCLSDCTPASPSSQAASDAEKSPRTATENVRRLFDGKSLDGWKVSDFAGHGIVEVVDGNLRLGFGETLTGVSFTGADLPTDNYEISLEAKRTEGTDFFSAITFPVGKSYCSFVPGGWGGGVVGLSNIDGYDASDNQTSTFMTFQDKVWYRFRVRVTGGRIQCWINDRMAVNQVRKGRKIDVRIDIEEACPLGISSYASTGLVRNITIRPVDKPADGEVEDLER